MEKGKIEARNDLILGIVLFLGSLFVLWKTTQIPVSPYEPLGAAFLPQAMAIGIGLCSLFIIGGALLKKKKRKEGRENNSPEEENEETPGYRRHPILALVVVVAFFFYILLMPLLGFRTATIIFILATGLLLGYFEKKVKFSFAGIVVTLISLGMSFGLYYLFTDLMAVILP